MDIKELKEKIRKMEISLNNPNIVGQSKVNIEAGLAKARTELAKMEQPSTLIVIA